MAPIKLINAVLAVIAGIGVALALYWVLNKLAEILPEKAEERVKPYFYILPAYAAITVYLIWPDHPVGDRQLPERRLGRSGSGWQNYTDLLSSEDFRQHDLQHVPVDADRARA